MFVFENSHYSAILFYTLYLKDVCKNFITRFTLINIARYGDISTIDGGSLKQEDKFTHLGSSVSATENDISICLAKKWTASDNLSII